MVTNIRLLIKKTQENGPKHKVPFTGRNDSEGINLAKKASWGGHISVGSCRMNRS